MIQAQYMLIRYIADPARNEALNVGIVAWSQYGYQFGFDQEAAKRVVRGNPHLAKDAVTQVESYLHQLLANRATFDSKYLLTILASENRFPLEITEPRFTQVISDQPEALEATYERLLNNLVHPRHRVTSSHESRVHVLAKQLQPLIKQHRMTRNHTFAASKTGTQRTVDFYANSGINLALDVVRLKYANADRIIEAADHQAHKIEDVSAINKDVQWLVYCDFSPKETLIKVNESVRKIITSSGAEIKEDIDVVARTAIDRVLHAG